MMTFLVLKDKEGYTSQVYRTISLKSLPIIGQEFEGKVIINFRVL